MRKWYGRKSLEERRAHIARRDKELARQRDRDRYHNDPTRRAYMQERSERYRIENPEKRRAHSAVSNAVRDGRLERGPCEVCGTTENVHGHHEDYDKPLEVRWLCVIHHAEEHQRMKEKV
jgi:hypothetical protein